MLNRKSLTLCISSRKLATVAYANTTKAIKFWRELTNRLFDIANLCTYRANCAAYFGTILTLIAFVALHYNLAHTRTHCTRILKINIRSKWVVKIFKLQIRSMQWQTAICLFILIISVLLLNQAARSKLLAAILTFTLIAFLLPHCRETATHGIAYHSIVKR